MTFDAALRQVRKHIADYERTMAREVILDPRALTDADALWHIAQPADPEHPDHLSTLRLNSARFALGRLHFYRACALDPEQWNLDFARAIRYLAPVADEPAAVPTGLDMMLGPKAEPDQAANLAADLLRTGTREQDPVFFDAVIILLTAAISRPSRTPAPARRYSNLGAAYLSRHGLGGKPYDLDRAIEAFEQAIERAEPGDPNLPAYQMNLGSATLNRHKRTGSVEDLTAATSWYDRALAGLPAGSASALPVRREAANTHAYAYLRTGREANLNRAIELYEHLAGTDAAQRAHYLGQLGTLYRERFLAGGPADDIDRALGALDEAIAATPESDPGRAELFSSLGLTYRRRYEDQHAVPDLELAVSYGERAINADDARGQPSAAHLSNLGLAYRLRYEHLDRYDDLERAVSYGEQAVVTDQADTQNCAISLHNLATAYRLRYLRLGIPAYASQAVDAAEAAVSITPDGHPMLVSRLAGLAQAYRTRFEVSQDPEDLVSAMDADGGKRPWVLMRRNKR